MQPDSQIMQDLSPAEETELAEREGRIEAGLKTFIEVGQELLTIRDKKLWRKHPTWEAYVNARWGFSRQRAQQLISGSTLALSLSTQVDIPNEKTARAIKTFIERGGTPQLSAVAMTIAIATAPNGKLTVDWVESTLDTMLDAIHTGGFVNAGAGDQFVAITAAITKEAHKKMMEKKAQLEAGRQKALGTFELTGEALKKVKPRDSEISLQDEGMYRLVVYPAQEKKVETKSDD